MLLVFDIGNTNVVLGVFRGVQLVSHWRLQSKTDKTVDEFALEIMSLLTSAGLSPKEVSQAILSCVVPALTRVFSKLCQKYFNVDPAIVSSEMPLGIELGVDSPKSIGSDRICNVVAAAELFGPPAIIIHFGTATTFDVLLRGEKDKVVFAGGIIAPGLLISAQALFSSAALLPSIELKTPSVLIGKNTQDAMLSGIVYGYGGLVEKMIERLKEELKISPKILATGGLARFVADFSSGIEQVVPDLTLRGMQILARRVCPLTK